MTDRKVVENATDARQGRTGKPVLIVLCVGLCLAAVAWVGAEFWGEATDAPTEQTATPSAGDTTPKSAASSSETSTTPPWSIGRRMPKAALADLHKATRPPEIH